MFFERIFINNFGVFRGTQILDLAPKSPEKPVVLIGGLNGSGKTTLLHAIQIALYGKRAKVSNRNTLPYDEYLRRSLNDSSNWKNCSIGLSFSRWADNEKQNFVVTRAWTAKDDRILEKLSVTRNGTLDQYLTDTWADYVEEMVPVDISELFFFDGERIEAFADPETSRQLLANGVNTLLGLNLVTRLQADLTVLERRKRLELKSDKVQDDLSALEAKIDKVTETRERLVQERAAQNGQLLRRKNELKNAQDSYANAGGTLFEQRELIEGERTRLVSDFKDNECWLRHLAEGPAPLLLAQDLLNSIRDQSEAEEIAAKSALVHQILVERDQELVNFLESVNVCQDARMLADRFLSQDRTRRSSASGAPIYLHLTSEAVEDLQHLQRRELPEIHSAIQSALEKNDELRNKIVEVDRKLAGVPSQDFLFGIKTQRDAAVEAVENAEKSLLEIDEQLRKLDTELALLEANYKNLLETTVGERLDSEDAQRTIEHSILIRETMDRFRKVIAARHTDRIATFVLDSFKRLLRKDSLLSDLTIDPDSFELKLYDAVGRVRSPERLSAGERQLLAVSLLWGLARASGYPLPVVVDTPLGRLDGKHRDNLVQNYYPNASHQVILLSTNKEIDSELFHKLEPFISTSYLLEYSDDTRGTEIKDGYFDGLWQSNTSDFLSRQKTSS